MIWKKQVAIFFCVTFICDIPTSSAAATLRVTECEATSSITIECDPGSTVIITKGVCVTVPSCDDYDPSLESQCDNSDRTAQWAPYCETNNPCSLTSTCTAGSTCSGEYSYTYAEYECLSDGTTEGTIGPTSQAPVSDLLGTSICGTRPALSQPRVFGGSNASPGEIPWIGSLRIGNGSDIVCGATLITSQWVLTAAHCMGRGIDRVFFGSLRLSGASEYEVKVARNISHPDYDAKTHDNDIALLRLNESVSFSDYLMPACIASSSNEWSDYRRCLVAGWGEISEMKDIPETLQKAEVNLLDQEWCNSSASYNGRLTDNMICAGYEQGMIDTCQGDSGGPLTCEDDDGRWYLVGATSFGTGCARPLFPGVYTRISQFQDFITAVVSDGVSDVTTEAIIGPTSQAPSSGLFFPYGLNEGDEFLPANDDDSTNELPISVAFPFFDHDHTSLFVNNNGVISFSERVPQYTPDPFPLADGRRLLTPFWADVDTTNGGTLSYRQVLRFAQNDATFLEADGVIRAKFVDMRDFVSSWMYIATWDRVAFYGASNTAFRNSFQAVMVTDGRYSFAIFNYGDINWTTGAASGGDSDTGLGGTPAQVGFNAGDGVIFYSVPGSRTAAVVDIETTSNIGVPGRWVFRTDNSNIEGLECTTSGDISLFPLVGSMLGRTQVLINGPCFHSNNLIICDFDGFETSGRLLEDEIALCVSPTFYKVGQIPLRVSLDDGLTFDFTGLFTIVSVEDVPDNVFSSVTESNQRESDFEITWNTDNLEGVDKVDIVVYGYREESEDNVVEFSGPLIIVAEGVDYHLGHYSVSGLPDLDIHYDVGVIGVMESEGQGRNQGRVSNRAALWSGVHVLQWHNGDDVTNWCNDWIGKQDPSDVSFLSVTHPCPCTLDQAQIDIGRFSPHPLCDIGISSPSNCIHKHGAIHCVRADTPSTLGGGQECCYGDEGMIINVFDSLGGGYSHRYHHGGVTPYGEPKKVPYLSHYLADILPWTYCCTYGGPDECTNFGRQRPSQTCNNYVPPPPALGNGDPHISTLDSTTYTFNGHGEFTLLNALNYTFILQARTAPLVGTSDATVFVAMAARFGDSDVIHVQTNERRVLDAYVRLAGDGQHFTRIAFDQASRWSYSGVSVTGRNITSDGIIVSFDGGVGLTLRASEGAMSILLVAPYSFRGQTQGLMGTWNGDASDDFLTPQGSFLSPDLTTEELHYQFGLLWEIDAAKSLFYYEPGKDHESHTDRTFTPVFEPVVNPFVDQSLVVEVCGTNQFCIFDYQTTGSQSFARNSVEALVQYQQAVDSRASFVSCPTLPAPANGSAIAMTYMTGDVARFVCDAGFELSHVVNLTCQSDLTWSAGDIPKCISETMMPLGPVLSTPLIIGICVGSVILIVLIVIVSILICRPKTLPRSIGKVHPSTDQAEVQANPTYVHA